MALPSSKSSSGNSLASANPITARPLNPSPRSSETTNPMRRSFSGNPFAKPSIIANPRGFNPATPANSPSEFPRRRDSIPCPLREHEEKENGNDPSSNSRQARVRSPSIISKGSKHFMSPTISAASKFNPSPRKKILSERNSDQIHSSITSISDLRSSCGSVNISGGTEEPDTKMNARASQDSTVTDSEAGHDASSRGSRGSRKKVAFDSVIHEIPPMESTDDDMVNVDEEFVNPKLPSSPLVAPLDADPLVPLPPYDPKTNYLSPRPQFLHYRPNPRIQSFIGDEGNFTYDPLKDGFDLEGLTDTDVSTEETSQSERESDDASSNETTKEEAGPEPKLDDLNISEEEIVEEKETAEMEEAIGAEELPKRSFFTRTMFIASMFIALIACSAMVGTQYSPMGYLNIKDPSFPLEAQQLRDNIAENMRVWYANSLSYLSELVSEFRGNERGELQFYNLTDLGENPWLVKNDLLGSPIQSDGFENLEVGSEDEEQIEYSETEEEVVAEKADDEGAEVPGDEPEEQEEDEIVGNESVQEVEILDAEVGVVEIDTEVHVEMPFAAEKHEAPLAAEPEYDQPEVSPLEVVKESETPNVEATDQAELANIEGEDVVYSPKEEEGSIELEADHNTASEISESAESSQITAPVGVLVTLLAAVACLVYAKKRTTPGDAVPPVKGIHTQEPLVAKKFDISPVAAIRATEFDVVGVESCPSEMSSFQNYPTSSTHSKGTKAGLGKHDEARSGERKTIRRESTASSYSDLSLGSSASFGSFTTYEMIPSKLRNGDEELVITPIRRSSRLRKQVTSP